MEGEDPLLMPLKRDTILEREKLDTLCKDGAPDIGQKSEALEETEGVLCRRHSTDKKRIQVVLSASTRRKALQLAHEIPLAGYTGQPRMLKRLSLV